MKPYGTGTIVCRFPSAIGGWLLLASLSKAASNLVALRSDRAYNPTVPASVVRRLWA